MERTSGEAVLEPEELEPPGAEGEEPEAAPEPAPQAESSLPEPGIDAEPGAGEQLSDEELVQSDVAGHPLQYATTRSFLDRFGLGSLEELPRDSELSRD